MDYRAKEWYRADDYPYSTGDRFIVEYAILSMITPNNEISRNHASHVNMTLYNSYLLFINKTNTFNNNYLFYRIASYATTHTADSVYIIGGLDGFDVKNSRIAKFQENIWSIAGSLKQGRAGHKAITVSGNAIILGGNPDSASKLTDYLLSGKTDIELWDFVSTETEIFNSTLRHPFSMYQSWEMGLFAVSTDFCSTN